MESYVSFIVKNPKQRMKSPYFNEEHSMFRDSIRTYLDQELSSQFDSWEKNIEIPRSVWERLGEMGYLGICHEEKYGGIEADWFTNAVFIEELGHTLNYGFAVALCVHTYMGTNHLAHIGNDAQKEKYLKPSVMGNYIAALAMTEPQTGSNLRGIKSNAVDEGKYYVLNGAKTFITNGYYGDYAIVCCTIDSKLSLLIVDLDEEGVTKNKLKKIGMHTSDTAEIFFDDVKVPKENLLGEEGKGFYYLSESLQTERIVLATLSIGAIDAILSMTKQYMHEREAFGKSLNKFQILRHKIASLESEFEAVKQLVYSTIWKLDNKVFAVKECSMSKLLAAELHKKVADECLQIFGGYGYMEKYPIARAFRDARAATIIGGTSEIMMEIIAKMSIDGVTFKKVY